MKNNETHKITKTEVKIGAKRVYEQDWQTLNLHSGFKEKGLCDGPTFSAGTACVYSCEFCYVPGMFAATQVGTSMKVLAARHREVVIRRTHATAKLREALHYADGTLRFKGSKHQGKVCYGSPLVDVAATRELAKETVEMVSQILGLTDWHVRLLSKSPLLEGVAGQLAARHADAKDRLMIGFSTGSMNNKIARAIETGTPPVQGRLQALKRLQESGWRTFGMVCPILPHRDIATYVQSVVTGIGAQACEHVWAEVLNARGQSIIQTCSALRAHGLDCEACSIEEIGQNADLWEAYARKCFWL